MANEHGKWTYSSEEERWGNECFDTFDEAITAGRNSYASNKEETDEDVTVSQFFVGQISNPVAVINVDSILETVDENYYEQCGDYAEGWHNAIAKEDTAVLEKMMHETFVQWQKLTNNKADFYKVINVVVLDVKEGVTA